MIRIVVVETSGRYGEGGLADAGGLLASRLLNAARQHARDLAPALRELLAERQWHASAIDLLLVDLGPGSYTGLRVGITTVKTLAYATGAAVLGVDAMAVLAESAPPEADKIGTVVDAQQGMVYAALFERSAPGKAPSVARPTAIVPAEQWAAELPAGTFVTGPALQRHAGLVPDRCHRAPESERSASVAALWAVGMRLYAAGRRDDFWKLEPLYLRPSAAEDPQNAKRTPARRFPTKRPIPEKKPSARRSSQRVDESSKAFAEDPGKKSASPKKE